MKSFNTITIGETEHKLRLTTGAVMSIEKKLGKSMLTALENVEENMVETLVTILWGALRPFNKDITFEKAVDLLDDYFDDGNSLEQLMGEMNSLLETSGFFSKGQD